MHQTLYWHDYETTGIHPARDRVIQFAGIRTDMALNVIEESPVRFCRLSDDVLPDPEALLLTGIHVELLQEQGEREIDFIKAVLADFSQPATCVCGYNSLRFDDEFTRNTLYRNLLDPYAREWQGGNSRWDIIDLVRMAHALRPEGIEWPVNDHGHPSFRLEHLTEANGISHQHAHDALSDVHATIRLGQLIRQKQPRLYDYLFELRNKKQVLSQLYPLGKTPLLHVSSMYPAALGCMAAVLPITAHPTNGNGVLVYDLSVDPEPLITLTAEEIHRHVFTRQGDLNAARIPLKTLHINRCPAIAPLATLTPAAAEKYAIDQGVVERHMSQIQQTSGLVEKIQDAFQMGSFEQPDDPDLMLYSGGFFETHDRQLMTRIHELDPAQLATQTFDFQDDRLAEMLFRFRARNYPDSLTELEQQKWVRYKTNQWEDPLYLDSYFKHLQALEERPLDEDQRQILAELRQRALQFRPEQT